jgi:zona occludens toxin
MGSTIYATGGVPSLLGGSVTTSSLLDAKAGVPAPVQAPAGIPAHAVFDGNSAANPFRGLTVYYVGNINNLLLFQIEYPDKTYLSVDSHLLSTLGYTFTRLSWAAVRLEYEHEVIFAFAKPKMEYTQPEPQPITDQMALIN